MGSHLLTINMRVTIFLVLCLVTAYSMPQRGPGRRGGKGRRGPGGRCRDGSPRPCSGGAALAPGGVDHRGCLAGARSRDKFCCRGATPSFDGHSPATKPCPLSDNGGSPVCDASYCP